MKKRVVATFAIIAALGAAIATYAFAQQGPENTAASASCCKSKDSCPMKSKGHDKSGEHAKMDCCKKHDSGHTAHKEGSCCACCGDSCPMKKDGEAAATSNASAEGDKNFCDNCSCCKDKHGANT